MRPILSRPALPLHPLTYAHHEPATFRPHLRVGKCISGCRAMDAGHLVKIDPRQKIDNTFEERQSYLILRNGDIPISG